MNKALDFLKLHAAKILLAVFLVSVGYLAMHPYCQIREAFPAMQPNKRTFGITCIPILPFIGNPWKTVYFGDEAKTEVYFEMWNTGTWHHYEYVPGGIKEYEIEMDYHSWLPGNEVRFRIVIDDRPEAKPTPTPTPSVRPNSTLANR